MGSKILFHLVILPFSKLPYPVLYFISDALGLVLYYVVKYRREVVLENLKKSFPEKTEKEIKRISKLYYRHMADLVMESVKNFSIGKDEALRRMVITNPEIVNEFAERGQSVILSGGHYCNWELWALTSAIPMKHKLLGVYKKIKDQYLNDKMYTSRGKYGLKLIPTNHTGEYLRANPQELKAVILAIDQSPPDPTRCLWVKFLGRDTAAYMGVEKYSKEFGYPVLFGHLRKVKRGFYEASYEVVFETPSNTIPGQITQQLQHLLEKEIIEKPEFWLWSHKRWKHTRPVNIQE